MADRTRDIVATIGKCPNKAMKASLLWLAHYLIDKYDEEVGAAEFMTALEGLEILAGKALETPVSDDAHKKLQTDLGLAEVRIKQLQEQLTVCEAALAERDARVLALDKLVRHAVLYAGRTAASKAAPRWVAIKEVFALGSTTARQLCRAYQFDPEEKVGAAKR